MLRGCLICRVSSQTLRKYGISHVVRMYDGISVGVGVGVERICYWILMV